MKWLKKIWRLYWHGARCNDFPISKYGIFGERIKHNEDARRKGLPDVFYALPDSLTASEA